MLWKFFRAFSFSNSNEFKDEKIPAERQGLFLMLFRVNYLTLIAPLSSLIVKFVTSQTSLGPQYWIGPG